MFRSQYSTACRRSRSVLSLFGGSSRLFASGYGLLLEREHVAPPGEMHGRIPAFFDTDQAANQLAGCRLGRLSESCGAVPDRR
jgi:hypothetical protein